MKTRVLGVTSVAEGSPFDLKQSKHLFFMDFDAVPMEDVWTEALRLFHKWSIDIFIFQSSRDGYHVLSFDILNPRLVRSIQADVRIVTDYPLITERIWDKFLTLRVSIKGDKGIPQFRAMIVCENKYLKSKAHYSLYKAVAGLPDAPSWYKNFWQDTDVYLAHYQTGHRLKEEAE